MFLLVGCEANKSLLEQTFTDCEFNDYANAFICNNYLIAAYQNGTVGVTNNEIKCISNTFDSYCKEIEE